jgi:arabinose-5-phosphate isomerase
MNNPIIKKAKQVISIEIEALQRISDLLNEEFVRAVKLIASANKVVISGVGKSGIIGQKISATFSSTGVSSVFLHPVEALHGDIGMVQKDDVVILISKSGNTEELTKLIPYLKMRSAKIIAIVGNTSSFLAANSDIVLDVSVELEACPFNLAPTASTTVTLAIGDALAVCMMIERKFTLEDFSRLHPLGQIGKTITLSVKDVMHKFDDIATTYSTTIFRDALILMSQKPLGGICIINEKRELIGILTDGDVRRVLQNFNDILDLKMEQIMTSNPITIEENAPIIEALALMENRNKQISVLPVVRNKVLIGLIRIHDIFKR